MATLSETRSTMAAWGSGRHSLSDLPDGENTRALFAQRRMMSSSMANEVTLSRPMIPVQHTGSVRLGLPSMTTTLCPSEASLPARWLPATPLPTTATSYNSIRPIN